MGIGEYWVLEFWTLWVLGIAVSGSVGVGYWSSETLGKLEFSQL